MTKFSIIDKASALTPEALSFLKDYDQRFFPTPWDEKSWEQVFDSASERFILLADDGFVLFDINGADSFAHLLKILVNPDKRGAGLGKALLSEAIEILKSRGMKTFFLEVEENNDSAIGLYQTAGFKIIHKKKHFYSNGATAFIMTLSV
nr:GNAT family N-acetyltransferase [Bacteriovorax sp. HI3]